MSRYTPNGWCEDCGAVIHSEHTHDAFHARIDRLTDMRVNRRGVAMVGGLITDEPSLSSITATDWQAAHDAGEDEELRVPETKMLCAMCGTEVHRSSGSSWRCDRCRMWRDAIPAPADPHLLCGECGTEIARHDVGCLHLADNDDPGHIGTLTQPEPHVDPCDCDDCRPQPTLESQPDTPTEPPVGSVARCSGCGNVYVHKADGWLATDGPFLDSWGNLARSFCGPVKVIYNPEKDK